MFLWVYLFEHDEGHDSQRGKESSDEDHDDAHRDAAIQAGQRWDPPAENQEMSDIIYFSSVNNVALLIFWHHPAVVNTNQSIKCVMIHSWK